MVLHLKGQAGKLVVKVFMWKCWTSGPLIKLPEINYKLWQVWGRRWAQTFRDPHTTGKSRQLKLWIRTWAIAAWLNTLHIVNPNHSKWKYTLIPYQPHLPSATTNCCFTPSSLLIGLISLIELHLRNMWESGLVVYQDYTQAVIRLCCITTINICNNKCLKILELNLGGTGGKKEHSVSLVEPLLSEHHPAVETLSFTRICD